MAIKIEFLKIDLGEIMKRKIFIALAVAGMLLGTISTASASGLANARAIGMAGAYTSLAKGYDCPSFNPANLGFESHRSGGFQLFGLGVSISNNSFSLDDYNSYTGAVLSEDDKENLLSKIPAEGLKVTADAEASALAVGMGNFAISLSGIGAAEINLGRAPMELLLQGNTLADTVDVNDMYGEGYGLASLNFSYGRLVYKNVDRQLSVGGTFHYLHGFGYEEIIELNGEAVTMSTGFEGEGSLVARTATAGSGIALDLGAALKVNKDYTVGVALNNFLSVIKWSKNTKEHRFTFEFDTLNVGNMGSDSIITSTDTTIDIGSFSSHLPSSIKAGLAKTTGSFLWAVDWEQGFRRAAGSSATPRISTGGEYRPLGFLPLRAGFAIGGKQGTTYAGGFGLDISAFYLDLAAANYNAVSGPAGKGLNFAVNGGFRF
jgi:hypothetical protein